MGNKAKIGVAALLLLICAGMSLLLGASGLPMSELANGFVHRETVAGRILWHVRLPRTLATALCGAALGVAGALIQSVLYNPLAGPNIIGVNAGAGLGSVLCLALAPAAPAAAVGLCAFAGAALATSLVYLIARRAGSSRLSLVLAGVALSALFTAGIDAVTTLAPDCLAASNQFKIGGAAGATMKLVSPLLLTVPLGIALAIACRHELELLSLGEETAHGLGLRPARWRLLFLGIGCLLAGSAISVMGLIGFVGLLTPHMARFWISDGDQGAELALSALLGGALLTVCDLASRTLFAPFELPVGILLSALGAPFFLLLLVRRRAHD